MDDIGYGHGIVVHGRRWPWLRRRALPSGIRIPSRALLIWRERPDLQAAFDLATATGREQLVWWYVYHGFREFRLRFDEADDAGLLTLNGRMPGVAQHDALPITRLMWGMARQAGLSRAALRTPSGQRDMLDWFFAHGLMAANLGSFLPNADARILLSPTPDSPETPYLFSCLWRSSPDLARQFAGPTDPAFATWCKSEGAQTFPILRHPLIALAPPLIRRPAHEKPFGVNLFGHARSRSGVSEDVRMAAQVLKEAGIRYTIHDVPAGPSLPDEEAVASDVSEGLPYAINLFAMTAPSTLAAVQALGGPAAIAHHHNIGFWPWELPELPELWHQAYTLMDEIWASSRFTYDAFCRSAPIPVRHMPFAVAAEESSGQCRRDFNLPDDPFLFGFAYDGLSGFARKAPLLTIAAFRQAFAPDDRSVGLVIKGLRAENDPSWQQVLAAIEGDPRIHLVTRSLDRGSLLDLWRSIDCFVSLHRSEGFGRNIAECMTLGKPVVVTGHSGNMDFTVPGAAALVPFVLRDVEEGEYPFGTGQQWAEPDVAEAARLMQRIVKDLTWRSGLALSGQQAIAQGYAPSAISRAWNPALSEIYG